MKRLTSLKLKRSDSKEGPGGGTERVNRDKNKLPPFGAKPPVQGAAAETPRKKKSSIFNIKNFNPMKSSGIPSGA